MPAGRIFTIGHSTHAEEHFLALLRQHGIDAVADVRSSPYSRMQPQFNREALRASLQHAGISYVFLGGQLGARSDDKTCYIDSQVQFDRLAATESFRAGIERLVRGAEQRRIALLCAEKEPLDCHRTILVARHVEAAGLPVTHILAEGALETHAEAMARLARTLPVDVDTLHLFRSDEELLDDVYRMQGRRIAYRADEAETDAELHPLPGGAA